jgi:hypothetical protein
MKTFAFPVAVLEKVATARPSGYLDAVLAAGTVTGEGPSRVVTLTEDAYAELLKRFSGKTVAEVMAAQAGAAPTIGGPGTELTKLLKRFGIDSSPQCQCRSMARQMDAWGCDECAKPERIDEVLAVMRAEAAKRRLPFLDAAGRMLIRRAIANARRSAS